MASVHESSILRGEVDLAGDVDVGPGCVLDGTVGPITVDAGTRLFAGCYLHGPLRVGAENLLYPSACLGFAPQSVGFDPDRAGPGVVTGRGCIFREGATVHRAMTDEGPTTIGDSVYFMTNSHAGHDSRVGDHTVLASGVLLGGHVVVGERVMIGGGTVIHQFCRIGRGSMHHGGIYATRDVPPYFMLTDSNIVGSVNAVGMRRQKLEPGTIEDVRWAFKTLYRRGLDPIQSVAALKERADRPMIAEYVRFIEESKRGICTNRIQWQRSGRA